MTVMSLHQGHSQAEMHLKVVSHLHPSPLPGTTAINLERCLKAHSVEQALQLCLPGDFHNVGPRACENCKGLVEVNLTCTEITALLHSTFAHCVALNCMWLPPRLTQIGKEVFLNCVALQEVVIPTELCDTDIHAFCGCEQLQRFTPPDWGEIEQSVQTEHNAFFMCDKFEDHCGWSCSPLKDRIRMSLTKSYAMNFPNIGPVRAGVMVGALASVSRNIPGSRNSQ